MLKAKDLRVSIVKSGTTNRYVSKLVTEDGATLVTMEGYTSREVAAEVAIALHRGYMAAEEYWELMLSGEAHNAC